jgi:hypothetical protein
MISDYTTHIIRDGNYDTTDSSLTFISAYDDVIYDFDSGMFQMPVNMGETIHKYNSIDSRFIFLLNMLGHPWALKMLYSAHFERPINLSEILMQVIKYNNIKRVKYIKALQQEFYDNLIEKINQYNKRCARILPTIPREYQNKSSIRKTSPPLSA